MIRTHGLQGREVDCKGFVNLTTVLLLYGPNWSHTGWLGDLCLNAEPFAGRGVFGLCQLLIVSWELFGQIIVGLKPARNLLRI